MLKFLEWPNENGDLDEASVVDGYEPEPRTPN